MAEVSLIVSTRSRKEMGGGRATGLFPPGTSSADTERGRCPWPVCSSLCPTLASLSQEPALRLSTKAPCCGGFEAEVPISRLITELIRQLGDSCWGVLWGPGMAPARHLLRGPPPPARPEEAWPPAQPVCGVTEGPKGERRDRAAPRSSPGAGLVDGPVWSVPGGSQ